MVPISVRREDERGSLNNQVTAVFVDLPVGEPDPVARLAAIRRQMDEYKRTMQAVDARSIIAMGDFVSPTLLALGARASMSAGQLWCQAVTTNVPGPRVPLYVLGRRMVSAHPYVPIAGGTRVSIGIFSYLNSMTFGINADFDAFPDVDVLSEGICRGIAELVGLAAREPALTCVVNPNAPEFLAPGDMPARVQAYCDRTGAPVPETPGAVARCVVDSLALSYRITVEDIAAVTGTPPPAVHITGGGARNQLLAQATADATGLPVHCGPVEATALGNAAVQLVALGELADVAEVRAVVARTTEIRTSSPRPDARWEEAAARLRQLTLDDDRRRGLLPR